MLAENISMNIALVDIIILGESRTQARGIKYRAGADDMALGNIRKLVECISQNVNGVADYYVYGIGRVFCNLRDDALCDVYIRLCKLESCLTGLSCNAGCGDNDVGISRIAIVARVNGAGIAERRALTDIKSLSERLLAVDIDHNDFRGKPHDCKRIGNGGTYASGSDDGNFVHDFFSC